MAYELIKGQPAFVRSDGKRLVLVQIVGDESFGDPWGYTIWQDGRCVAGACHWNWDAPRAEAEADKALAAQAAMDGQ